MAKDKHKHHKCEHNIEYCAPCNEAYCVKCDTIFTSTPCMQQHYSWTSCTCQSSSTWTYPGDVTVTYPTGISSSNIVLNDPENITLTDGHDHHSVPNY